MKRLVVSMLMAAVPATPGCSSGPLPGATGLYFGQSPPGDDPEVFAPGIISHEGRFEQFLLMAADSSVLVFGLTNDDWSEFSLHTMERVDGRWRESGRAPFQGEEHGGLTAALSHDGNEAFFTAAWPAYPPSDIWRSVRSSDRWSVPVKVDSPVSSTSDEWEVSIAANGTLYFSSDRAGGEGGLDLYRAPRVRGGYPRARNLGPSVNSEHGDDLPFIAPDESYLIFASDRPGGEGNRDLYISFRRDDGWTEARSLGSTVNSPAWDIYPSVSPDGRFLFFARRDGWQPDEDSEILWVSTDVLERLRPQESR